MKAVGDAMIEVGTAMTDAGDAMVADADAADASHSDVAVTIDSGPRPPRAITADCDHVYTTTITTADFTITTTTWQAEIEAPTITTGGPIPRFWFRQCEVNRETFGTPSAPCPAGATCAGTPATTPDCYVNGGGPVVEGRIVLTCGTRSQVNHVNPAIADSDTGSRLTSIDVEIE